MQSIIDNAPPEFQRTIRQSLLMTQFGDNSAFQFAEKVTSEHIDKMIDNSEKVSDRSFRFASRQQIMNFFYILVSVGVFIFLTIYLSGDNPQLYKDIISYALTFLAGTGLGFGIKSHLSNKDND